MHPVSTQTNSPSWDEEVDLRRYVTALIHNKWIVLAIVAAAVAVAGIANYAVLPSVYKSSGVVSLPAADTKGGLGMAPRGYAEFASSEPMLESVRQSLGVGLAKVDLQSIYVFNLDSAARSIAVTASAPTKEQAATLARAWVAAFKERAEAEVVHQFTQLKESAIQKEASLQPKLAQAEASLSRNERENPLGLMEARLKALEQELVAGEVRLRHLTSSAIPLDEALLAFLQKTLEETPKTLPVPLGTAGASNSTMVTNPAYLQLSQELVTTGGRLAVSRKEAEVLAQSIPVLDREAQQLRATIVAAREAQEPLTQEVRRLWATHSAAAAELERLLELESRIPELSQLTTIQEPAMPIAPVSPQRIRNVVLAGVLGAFLGVVVVFFQQWYRAQPQAPTSQRERVALDTSPEEVERQRRQPVG